MSYEILYEGAFPLIKYRLKRGERLKAESDAMVAMDATIDVTGGVEGGLLSGIMRRFTGESFFFQYLTAARGDGEVLLAHAYPGGIVDVDLDGSYGLIVQKSGFLASTDQVQIETKVQNLFKGLFSGEGFFVVKVTGKGTVFLSSYGAIHPINLEAGQEIVVDNGHLVAWADYMQYSVEKANGWINSFTSGECMVCRFKGPGVVLIQTRNPNAFDGWIHSFGYTKGNKEAK